MKLFKYVPPERVDILANERISFTPPIKFSDPHEMRLKLSSAAKKEFKRRLFEQIEKQAEREIPGYRQLSSRQRKMGALCLCTNNKNNLMWDHYTKGYQGFVIEFDGKNTEFKDLGMPWKIEFYRPENPAFCCEWR